MAVYSSPWPKARRKICASRWPKARRKKICAFNMAEGTAEEAMCIKVAWATTLKLSTQVSEQTTKTRQKIVH